MEEIDAVDNGIEQYDGGTIRQGKVYIVVMRYCCHIGLG